MNMQAKNHGSWRKNPIIDILDEAPSTSVEIAALLMRSVVSVNASLQSMKRRGIVRNTHRKVPPIDKQDGRFPFIWELA